MNTRSGYTLLEICLALMVLAIIMGFLIPSTRGILDEEQIRGVTNKVSDLARSARHQAVSEGQQYAIVLFGGTLYLLPWAGDSSQLSNATDTVKLSGEMTFELRPGGNAITDPKTVSAWIFQPDGLSDPMEVRIRSGRSWIVESFSPLTASVDDEHSSFE